MSLSTILNEMKLNRPNAEMDVQFGNPNTLGGRQGLKRAATEALKRLRNSYRDELMKNSVFIVVSGAQKDVFTEFASGEKFGCFVNNPESFYKELAAQVSPPSINPPLWTRESVKHLFGIAQNVLNDKALELDINSYPPLYFNEKYNRGVTTAEEFAPILKQAINDQVGSEIVGINAVHSILDQAIVKEHSGLITPILLPTDDEAFALDLFNSLNTKLGRPANGTFLVAAGKNHSLKNALTVKKINEETVAEVLETIRNKVL